VNSRKKFYAILILLFSIFSFSLFADSATLSSDNFPAEGIDCCDFLFSVLKEKNYKPVKQNLLSTGSNFFPYNIVLNSDKEDISSNTTLIFIIKQEDAVRKPDLMLDFVKDFFSQNQSFNKVILFSYGDDYLIEKGTNIQGSQIFFNSLTTTNNKIAIILDFSEDANKILSNSGGMTSPSGLLKITYNTILQSKINFRLPNIYLSNLYTYKVITDNVLNMFLKEKIPAIKIQFTMESVDSHQEEFLSLLNNLASNVDSIQNENFDQHFLIIRFFGRRYVRISEHTIVIIIISIIFSFLLFLFLFTFINNRIEKENWLNVRKIWYIAPIVFLLILCSLYLGLIFSRNLMNHTNALHKSVFSTSIQFIISFILIGIFNTIQLLYNKKYNAQSFDYLIIFCTFINQFIFIYLDVSFFPVFMFICLLAILSHIFKNKYVKLVLAILMLTPIISYIRIMISVSGTYNFNILFQYNHRIFIFLALYFYPIYLVLLRFINTFISQDYPEKKIILMNIIIAGALCIFICGDSLINYKTERKRQENKSLIILGIDSPDQIQIKYKDKFIFDNTIRTLQIKIPEDTEECQVSVSSKTGTPVLYSDNSFVNVDKNLCEFLIPNNPPEEMYFSYGIPEKQSQIIVTIFTHSDSDNSNNTFNRIEKCFNIE